MSLSLILQKLKDNTIKVLRFLFEDKEMQGDRFDDLKCSKSGAMWVDIKDIQASDSYKKAREQSDIVLGIKAIVKNNGDNTSDTRIDSFGRVLLPNNIRRQIVKKTQVELGELADGNWIILLSPEIGTKDRQQYNLDDLLKEPPK